MISRPYGRFYHLPKALVLKGHEVQIALCSYLNEPDIVGKQDGDGILWHSSNLLNCNPTRYYLRTRDLVRDVKPDWIIGFSDSWYGIIAQYLAEKHGCKSLIDAYDNYESYIPWCFPLHQLWRRALGRASVVSAAGPQLATLLQHNRAKIDAKILPMAADPEFVPINKFESRKKIGLTTEKKLIGYCGSIYRSRGIEFLFRLADRLSLIDPMIQIVASGRKEKGLVIPQNIRWLGYLPDQQMPLLLNSMDVLLVLNRESSFGQYSYPVKLYEAMQCRIPVVASETAPARWILGGDRRFLGNIGDLNDFSVKVIAALDLGESIYPSQSSWGDVVGELEKILR